jgi:hypothetical protein
MKAFARPHRPKGNGDGEEKLEANRITPHPLELHGSLPAT